MGKSSSATKRHKYEPIGSTGPTKSKASPPLDYVIKRFCRRNTSLLMGVGAVVVIWILMYLFGRARAASKFASSQDFEFASAADYKLPKRLAGFEALSRGGKQYAFNVMKGSVPYGEESKAAAVTGFDFCYTETKVYTASKRVAKTEKVHELTAMMFSAEDLRVKSLLISPRDMVLDSDMDGTVEPRADPDVDDLMRKDDDQKDADEDEDEDDDAEKPVVAAEAAATEANSTASEQETDESKEAEEAAAEPELDAISSKFNASFVVEALDVNQSAAVISPGLKQLLLKQPGFIVDFQDNRFLIYREFTFEPQDYHTVLALGKQILNELNREIPAPTEGLDPAANPVQFVSRSKDDDTP